MALHYNITGEASQELVSPNSKTIVSSISLTNVHSTNSCTVDLFIYSCSGTFYFLKGVNLPIGSTLVHNNFWIIY